MYPVHDRLKGEISNPGSRGKSGRCQAGGKQFPPCFLYFLYGLSQKTAIDPDISARDEAAGSGAGQENRGADEFMSFAEATHGCVAHGRLRAGSGRTIGIKKQTPVLFGRKEAGRNRVDAYIVGGPFAREELRKAQDRGF